MIDSRYNPFTYNKHATSVYIQHANTPTNSHDSATIYITDINISQNQLHGAVHVPTYAQILLLALCYLINLHQQHLRREQHNKNLHSLWHMIK